MQGSISIFKDICNKKNTPMLKMKALKEIPFCIVTVNLPYAYTDFMITFIFITKKSFKYQNKRF